MKKLIVILMCLSLLFVLPSCGKKDKPDDPPAKIGDIPTASSDDTKKEEEKTTNEKKSEAYDNYYNEDRNKETDNSEIESNLHDANELIQEGCYQDAIMIINGLETRDLTDSQRQRLNELKQRARKLSN